MWASLETAAKVISNDSSPDPGNYPQAEIQDD